jgi:hypothetical protein
MIAWTTTPGVVRLDVDRVVDQRILQVHEPAEADDLQQPGVAELEGALGGQSTPADVLHEEVLELG